MCRMLLAIGEFNISKIIDSFLLMANDQNETHERHLIFEKGTFKHKDGWGAAYLDETGNWRMIRSILPIFEDKRIIELKDIKTNLLILHARKASQGKIAVDNCHPFKFKEWVFCHNGGINETIKFNDDYKPKGDTDSERLFYSLLTDINKNPQIDKTVRTNIAKYKENPEANIVLANKNYSYVYLNKNDKINYYQMKFLKEKNQLIISSEVLLGIGINWKKLKQEDFVTVDNKTLEININSNG